jgi:hypothetical protein
MYILTAFRFGIQVHTTNYLISLRNVSSVYKPNILTACPVTNISQLNPGFHPKSCTFHSRLVNYELIQHLLKVKKKKENKAMEGWLGTK